MQGSRVVLDEDNQGWVASNKWELEDISQSGEIIEETDNGFIVYDKEQNCYFLVD